MELAVDSAMELLDMALFRTSPVGHGLAHSVVGQGVAHGLVGHGAGQVSHQSVSKPFQGEHRATTQSKAFGASVAAVVDSPNALHGAHSRGHVVAGHSLAHPVAHAVGQSIVPTFIG